MAKLIPTFRHPNTGVVTNNAYLRVGPFSVDPNSLEAHVRCDVYPSQAARQAAMDPVTGQTDVRACIWDGSFEISGAEFQADYAAVTTGAKALHQVFYEHATLKLKAMDRTLGENVIVLDGAVDV